MANFILLVPRQDDRDDYIGAAADTKPAAATLGSRAHEYDTGADFVWDGTAWRADSSNTSAASIADGSDVAEGAVADAAVVAGASGSVSAKLRSISRDTGALTETAPATDTASSGLNGRLQRIAQRLTSLIALLPTALGSTAAASSLAVTQSTEDVARQGIITETAPATDTASSGQNGRLQRIAQRLTSIIALLPAALGSGGGLKVDGSGTALPTSIADGSDVGEGATSDAAVAAGASGSVSAKLRRLTTDLATVNTNLALLVQKTDTQATTATVTIVGDQTSNINLLASNAARKGACFFNASNSALYIKFGSTAVIASSWTVLIAANGYYEVPRGNGLYTGAVDGIWTSDAGGSVLITEW